MSFKHTVFAFLCFLWLMLSTAHTPPFFTIKAFEPSRPLEANVPVSFTINATISYYSDGSLVGSKGLIRVRGPLNTLPMNYTWLRTISGRKLHVAFFSQVRYAIAQFNPIHFVRAIFRHGMHPGSCLTPNSNAGVVLLASNGCPGLQVQGRALVEGALHDCRFGKQNS